MSQTSQPADKKTENRNQKAIEVDSLRKEYPVGNGIEVAVENINLNVAKGEFVSIVGPSGCGKTTTLRCIAGLTTPTEGTISFYGEDMTDVPGNKRNIAMMFQNIALYPHMNIIDNISYPLKVRRIKKSVRYEEARKAAEIMQIDELLEKYPGDLSGGQRQRAALARTLVQDPNAFLMDEPLSDLDAKLKIEMRKEIQRIHKRVNQPTIYVTHDQEEAMTLSDKIVVMNNGSAEQIGTPEELYDQPNNKFVANFIGNPSMNFFNTEIIDENRSNIQLMINDSKFNIPHSKILDEISGSTFTIGVRPEDINVGGGDPYFNAEVNLIERTGENLLVTLIGPGDEMQSVVSPDTEISEGDTVEIDFDMDDTHIFDSDGKRIE